jgi:hypothetical protein
MTCLKNDRIKNDRIKNNRMKNDSIKSDRIKTDRIKSITDPQGTQGYSLKNENEKKPRVENLVTLSL